MTSCPETAAICKLSVANGNKDRKLQNILPDKHSFESLLNVMCHYFVIAQSSALLLIRPSFKTPDAAMNRAGESIWRTEAKSPPPWLIT